MKFRPIALFAIAILSISLSGVRANIIIRPNDNKPVQDTLRDEFNLKRKNITNLIKGKSPKDLLSYYEFYLQAKDRFRSDSLLSEILQSKPSADYRRQISLLSFRYTSDAKMPSLFLADPERLKEYRTYFLSYKVSSMKSDADKRAHYYDLVALDSAYYRMAPDTLVRKQMSHHYNNLAWYSILTQQLDGVEYYIDQSIRYDPQYKYPYSNLPLLLLLKGQYQKARSLYLKYKDQPFDEPGTTFKDEFLEDFKELSAAGITNKDIKKITKLLNSGR